MNVKFKNDIDRGKMESLTYLFSVEKGEDKLSMVYNVASRGLNGVLWYYHFFLPMVRMKLCALQGGFSMGDLDIGEIFSNLALNEQPGAICGVYVMMVRLIDPGLQDFEAARTRNWERRYRDMMGITSYPSKKSTVALGKGDKLWIYDRPRKLLWVGVHTVELSGNLRL